MDSENDSLKVTRNAEPGRPVESKPLERNAARLPDWLLIMSLAIAAGAAAWYLGEYTFAYFKPSLAASENYRDSTALNAEMPGVGARNGALTFGIFGGLLGLAMGLAGGLSRRSAGSALLGGLAGLVLGAAAGALPSIGVMPWQWRHRNDDPFNADLMSPLFVHLGLWSAVGLVAGLAYAIGRSRFNARRLAEAGFAGFVGAILGTFLFEMTGALLLPAAGTTNPFALTSPARLFARLSVATFIGLGIIRALRPIPANQVPGNSARTPATSPAPASQESRTLAHETPTRDDSSSAGVIDAQ